MKKRIFNFIFALVSIICLCSFSPKNDAKENNSLHKTTYIKNISTYCGLKTSKKEVDDTEKTEDTDERLGEIFSEFKELVPDGVPTDAEDIAGMVGIGEVIKYIASVFEASNAVKHFCLLLGIALLFCLAELLSEDAGEISGTVRGATSLILSIPILYLGKDIIVSVSEGIKSGSEFFSGIIPIFSSVAAIGAGGLTAGTATVTMNISLSFVSGVLSKNLLPMATLIFAISLLSSIDTGQGIKGVAKGIRDWFNFLIGLVSVVIVATLGAQTMIASSRDSLALRGAKYAISGMIPIVGTTVSGALSMLISGVKLLSGSMGVISVAVLLSFMGAPLIMLLFYRFCIGACITLTSFSGASFGERFFSSVRGAIDCLVAVLTSSILIFILEIIILTVTLGNLA